MYVKDKRNVFNDSCWYNIFVYNGGANTKDHWVINIRVGSS